MTATAMKILHPPTVDVRAPSGGRIILRPVISESWIPRTSRGGLALALVLLAAWFATGANRLNHTDLWGHLSFGRWMVEHRALPQSDPFRSFADSELFLNVPWLSQILGYLWYRALGAEGMVLAHALLMTLTAGGLALAVMGRGVSAAWAAAAAAAAYLLCLPIVGTMRPQVLGMAAFVGTLWAIAQLPRRRHPLFWLPILFALWANLHGSFLMGLTALAGFAAGSTWDTWRERRNLRATWKQPVVAHAWLALLLCVLGTCLNPLGVRLFPAVASFARTANLAGISEWRPTEASSLTGVLLMVSLVATVALVCCSPRRLTAWEALLLLGFGYLATTSIRMLVWWGLFWPWYAAPHAAAICRSLWPARAADSPHPPEAVTAARRRTLLVAVLVVLTATWSPSSSAVLGGRHRPNPSVFSPDTPYLVAEELASRGITGRIVAPMDWADYLIWRTGGAVEPLVYTHVHLSGPNLWEDFLHVQSAEAGWLELVDRYGLRYLVVSRARQPGQQLAIAREPRCRIRYEDPQALLVEILPRGTR
ncbi:MAG: hypothetical protein ABR915_12810 [Thermoguttaceae bacterium]